MKKKIKRFLKKKIPKLVKIYKILKSKKNHESFEGWGMTTTSTNPPWISITSNHLKKFNEIHYKISNDIKKSNFIDTTPENKEVFDTIETLEGLKWRHYIICATIDMVSDTTNNKNFVECGVGDGLSISYVLNKIPTQKSKVFLYDSWSPMIKKHLFTKKEYNKIGSYKNLNFKITKKNLQNHPHQLQFNKGYIPEVFNKSINPEYITWLHIDLNSSIPTLKCLEFFYDKIEINGLIIFDDYGWKGYEDTKEVIDIFLNHKKGVFFQFPTGQAVFIKK